MFTYVFVIIQPAGFPVISALSPVISVLSPVIASAAKQSTADILQGLLRHYVPRIDGQCLIHPIIAILHSGFILSLLPTPRSRGKSVRDEKAAVSRRFSFSPVIKILQAL
jgi:hypothetical protein